MIRYAAVGVYDQVLSEAVTFWAGPDRMVVREEGGAGPFNRDLTIAAVIGAFKDISFKFARYQTGAVRHAQAS